MLISYRWLQRHVDLAGITPREVAEDLTIHTAEVEGLARFAPWLDDVVVGRVVAHGRHPDADRLSVNRVDVGGGECLSIVCGAPNVGQGQTVAVARAGTMLPTGEDGSLVKLKKGRVRGQESQGMICSVRELQLGDEHAGIWVLDTAAPLGTPIARALGLEDWVVEIDNKSLTNRPDLWGHRGIAGEIAAIHGRPLRPLEFALPAADSPAHYPVRVETASCFRYLGLPIDGVANGPSPDWLRVLLLAVGQRPIDLLVDLSNFVMLDLGQPNHLFDRDRLSPAGIEVRDARPGETMATLDGIERRFSSADMLICSGGAPVAIAGVMGGEAARVEASTTRLLLEVASFHPTTVRRTSARLGLRTDASTRFEKYLDPTLPALAAAHLVAILRAIQPQVAFPQALGDAGDWTDPSRTIDLRPDRVREVLGAAIPDAEIARILASLGFGVARGALWRIEVPAARATKDIAIEEDLIEEVGRMYGYGRLPVQRIRADVEPPPREHRRLLVRRLEDRLSGAARFHQAMTHSFQSDALLAALRLASLPHVEVVNPVVAGYSKVRRSIVPSLLGVLAENRRHRAEIRLYEIGKGYLPEGTDERGQPGERHEIGLVWAAPRLDPGAHFDAPCFARLRGVVEDLVAHAGAEAPRWRRTAPGEAPPWAHPGKTVLAESPGSAGPLALVGELEPGLHGAIGLAGELDCQVAAGLVSIDLLLAHPRRAGAYRPLPRFPGVKLDVALALPVDVPAGDAAAAIEAAGKGLVQAIELFDVYRGETLGAGRKSLAYHVLLQSPERTLTDADAARFLARLERGAAELGGELRRD
ncbi:MAG: phenylalanine--tRNA ligase subunit beta [Planctomycetota bacterium]